MKVSTVEDLELLAEPQHYGAATTLVNFSRNAMIALLMTCSLWLACSADGKIFVVDPRQQEFKKISSVDLKKIILKLLRDKSKEKESQNSLSGGKAQAYINARIPVQSSAKEPCSFKSEKIVASSEAKQETHCRLENTTGIKEESGNPDLSTFAWADAADKSRLTKSKEHYYSQGIDFYRRKEFAKAIVELSKVIKLDQGYAAAYFYRGNSFDAISEYDKALVDFTKTIELDPNNAAVYNNRGLIYNGFSEYDKALAEFTKALELDPNYAAAYYNRGNAYSYKKEYTKAIADYTKALKLNPELAAVYHNRGISYLNHSEPEKAIADFNKVIELQPNNCENARLGIKKAEKMQGK